MKTCSKCGKGPRKPYSCWCGICLRGYAIKHVDFTSDKWHGYQLKHKFGITHEQFLARLKSQNNGCAICGVKEEPSKRYKRFAVDHIKDTKTIRGILCSYCNQGIGLLKHDPKILRRAAAYCS